MNSVIREIIKANPALPEMFSSIQERGGDPEPLIRAAIFKRIFKIARKQVFVAMFVGILLRPSILGSLLWFPITSPLHFIWLLRGLFLYYFDDYLRVNELQPWLDSLGSLFVFVLTLASISLVEFSWYCLRTTLSLLVSFGFLRGSGIIYIGIVLFANFQISFLLHPLGNFCNLLLQARRVINRLLFDVECEFRQAKRFIRNSAPTRYIVQLLEDLANRWRFRGTKGFLYRRDCPLRSPAHIRLLRLPRRLPFAVVTAELISVNVQNNRHYECISYCWGRDPKWADPILLNNRKFLVPSNVRTILQRRASFFKEKLIWIDSICINQEDKQEKSVQVQMMREIYSRGIRVSACLGDADHPMRALNMVSWLARVQMSTSKEHWRHIIQDSLSRKITDRAVAADWEALSTLLRHQWFERVWIIQEIACNPWATVLYGYKQTTWDDLIRATSVILDDSCLGLLHSLPGSLPKGLIHAGLIDNCKRIKRRPKPIHILLRRFLAFKATKGVDKIFALVGLSRERIRLNELVDYKRSESDILAKIANFFLEAGDLLQVLHFAGIGWDARALEHAPSWAVDWTKSREPVPLAHPLTGRPYRASGGTRAHIRLCGRTTVTLRSLPLEPTVPDQAEISNMFSRWDCDIDTISMHGLTIGAVKEVLPGSVPVGNWGTMSTGGYGPVAFEQCVQSMHRMDNFVLRWFPRGYYNGQSAQEVLWRTVFADRTFTERPMPLNIMRHVVRTGRAVSASYDAFRNAGNTFPVTRAGMAPEFEGIFRNAEDALAFASALKEAVPLIGGAQYIRTLCITDNSYLALVPQHTNPGDIVCVLYGAQVPFVLRPTETSNGTKYRLVGECYLHGMMDGEGLQLNKPEMDFEIF
jgi:hypothetical protein